MSIKPTHLWTQVSFGYLSSWETTLPTRHTTSKYSLRAAQQRTRQRVGVETQVVKVRGSSPLQLSTLLKSGMKSPKAGCTLINLRYGKVFFLGLFFYVYKESPNPKILEHPTPQAPNLINWKPQPQKSIPRPQPKNLIPKPGPSLVPWGQILCQPKVTIIFS